MSKLSVLMGTYGTKENHNQRYLDLALKSLERQSFQDFELILVSSGSHRPTDITGPLALRSKHYHSDEQIHFPAAMKQAYSLVSDETDKILILNDDVILSRTCLESLYGYPDDMIANPLCNSDLGRRYILNLGFVCEDGKRHLSYTKPQYVYEEMAENFEDIVERSKIYPVGFLIQEWIAFFCTMISKRAYEKIGGIDPIFKTGKDDLDFCRRAKAKSIIPVIDMGSFVFHFGGATADKHLTNEQRTFNEEYYKEKWANNSHNASPGPKA